MDQNVAKWGKFGGNMIIGKYKKKLTCQTICNEILQSGQIATDQGFGSCPTKDSEGRGGGQNSSTIILRIFWIICPMNIELVSTPDHWTYLGPIIVHNFHLFLVVLRLFLCFWPIFPFVYSVTLIKLYLWWQSGPNNLICVTKILIGYWSKRWQIQ